MKCDCGGVRKLLTSQEKIEKLKQYQKDLEQELTPVKETPQKPDAKQIEKSITLDHYGENKLPPPEKPGGCSHRDKTQRGCAAYEED